MYGFLFGVGVAQNSVRQTCAPSLTPQPVCKQPTMVASCQLYVNYKSSIIYIYCFYLLPTEAINYLEQLSTLPL